MNNACASRIGLTRLVRFQNLWQSGKGCSAIASTLNDQKILTRGGKRWAKGIVSRIIKRHEEKEV